MGLYTCVHSKGTLPNYFLKVSAITTLSLGHLPTHHPPLLALRVMAKVADSHTWTEDSGRYTCRTFYIKSCVATCRHKLEVYWSITKKDGSTFMLKLACGPNPLSFITTFIFKK